MPPHELPCPVCSADIPLGGDERKGDEVFCAYCRAPSRLTSNPTDDECDLEEDF